MHQLSCPQALCRGDTQLLMSVGLRRCFLKDRIGQHLVWISYGCIVPASGALVLRRAVHQSATMQSGDQHPALRCDRGGTPTTAEGSHMERWGDC